MPDALGKIIPREHSKWWLYHPDRRKILVREMGSGNWFEIFSLV